MTQEQASKLGMAVFNLGTGTVTTNADERGEWYIEFGGDTFTTVGEVEHFLERCERQ